MFHQRKISNTKKKAEGNMSPYTGPFYQNIGEDEEMKTLRASPSKINAGMLGNDDMESGQRVSSILLANVRSFGN
jgi:hypothetical protein